MRVLFVMAYPGYVRYFDSTIRLLAERGHDLEIYFELWHKQQEGLQGINQADPRINVHDSFPGWPASLWKEFTQNVRRVSDFVRYLDPRFEDSDYLRGRVADKLPRSFAGLPRFRPLGRPLLDRLPNFISLLEQALPRNAELDEFIAETEPDLLVVTPLITVASRQNDLVKSAQSAGVPTVLAVGSWDHLTTKGLIRVQPDRALVWNDTQRREAEELHGYPSSRVVVTGAQPFDRWFDRRPAVARGDFCANAGLATSDPYILFVGSTASISATTAEQEFVARWVWAIREHSDPAVSGLQVLIRPHPYNSAGWQDADLSHLGDVSVWPRDGANPADASDQADYFHSLNYSAAVVGINTSAMIEAAIVGRPVLSVRTPEFADTQEGTLHFHYLLPEQGGFVRVATSLDEHLEQLAHVVRDPAPARKQAERFVGSFIRPHGLEQPATPLVVDAMEELAARGPSRPPPARPARYPLRAAMWTAAAVSLVRDPWRLSGVMRRATAELPERAERLGESMEDAAEVGAGLLRALDNASDVDPGSRDSFEPLAARLEEAGRRARTQLASQETADELVSIGGLLTRRLRTAAKSARAAKAESEAAPAAAPPEPESYSPPGAAPEQERDLTKRMLDRFESKLRGHSAARE